MPDPSFHPAKTIEVVDRMLEELTALLPRGGDLDTQFSLSDAPWKFNQSGTPPVIPLEKLESSARAVRNSIAVKRLAQCNAPRVLQIAEIAAASFRGYFPQESRGSESINPIEWMKPQDELCRRLGIAPSEKRTFRFWCRVARLNDLIEKKFEDSAKKIGFEKLASEGKPKIYVGDDRAATARLSGLYFKTVTDQFFRLCVLFACDTSNIDVYDSFLDQGGDARKIGLASHIDEYELWNVGDGRDLEEYRESFVRLTRSNWDKMGIPEDLRLEIDGLSRNPREIADALRRFHRALQAQQVWNHVIFGLGPEERPHIIFLDDLGEPIQLFTETDYVELSSYVQARDISRGQKPHSHAISLGTIEALSGTSMQQTFYVDPATGDPSKARGLVKALRTFPPNRHHSVGICQLAPSRWTLFTDSKSAEVILNSGIYSKCS